MHVHLKHSLWVYVSMLAKVLKFDPINGFRAQGSGSRNAARTPSEPISLKMLHTNHPDQCPYSMDRLVTCIYTHVTSQKKISPAANPVEPYRIITLNLYSHFLICNAQNVKVAMDSCAIRFLITILNLQNL